MSNARRKDEVAKTCTFAVRTFCYVANRCACAKSKERGGPPCQLASALQRKNQPVNAGEGYEDRT
jgi:hypothetical protein